jgi:hypothetical protein
MTGNGRVDQEADEPQRKYSLRPESDASTDYLTGIRALISLESRQVEEQRNEGVCRTVADNFRLRY